MHVTGSYGTSDAVAASAHALTRWYAWLHTLDNRGQLILNRVLHPSVRMAAAVKHQVAKGATQQCCTRTTPCQTSRDHVTDPKQPATLPSQLRVSVKHRWHKRGQA